jgi:hypothetical protein
MATRTPPPRRMTQRATPSEDAALVLVQGDAKSPSEKSGNGDPIKHEDVSTNEETKRASSRASTQATKRAPAPEPRDVDLTAPIVRTRPRYVEQFNTRLTPEMKAAVDKHVSESGEAIVDLVDRALRLALKL